MGKRKNRTPPTDREPKKVGRSKSFSFKWNGKEYKLTPLQKAFAEEYLTDYNAGKAAKRAGYKGNIGTLRGIGWENLNKPHISAYISYLIDDLGLNDDVVDKERLYVILQKSDLRAKTQAIRDYDKLKGRLEPERHKHEITKVNVVDYSGKKKEDE